MPPGFPGQSVRSVFGPHGKLAEARRLAGSGSKRAVYWTCDQPECIRRATIIARQLARIHLEVKIVSLPSDALYLKSSTPGAKFDITDGGWVTDYVDPADFLVPIATRRGITPAGSTNVAYYVDPALESAIAKASSLSGAARFRAFAAIERGLRTKQVPYVATALSTRPTLFSDRVGCMVNNPVYGLDLGVLCVRPS